MAHVEKRTQTRRDGNKPIVVWRGRYRGPDGREHSRTFRTKIAAQQWLATVETSKVTGEWIDPALGKIPCGDYIDSWLATKSDVAASTKLNIEGRIKKHTRPFFEDMPVERGAAGSPRGASSPTSSRPASPRPRSRASR